MVSESRWSILNTSTTKADEASAGIADVTLSSKRLPKV